MKKHPHQFIRLFYISLVMTRYGLDRLILSSKLFYPIRFLSYLNPFNWARPKSENRAVSLRLTLEALGPMFVKFGQLLSTRPDLIPHDIIVELAKLQDRVPPFSSSKSRKVIEAALGQPIAQIFDHFDDKPLASASIAQVHSATLKAKTCSTPEDVVVKVLRPGIKKVIKRDIALLYTLARIVERFWSEGYRLRPQEIVGELERTILDELDLMREAANASQLKHNFEGSALIYVPKVYWPYIQKNVIVMERIEGIPISDIDALKAHHINMKKLAERGVEIFFTQVFRDRFFHADMHPGNVFVSKKHPENPQYIAIDFGIMGSLSPTDQRYIAENLMAFFNRDYQRVAQLHVDSGWVPADTRVDNFEAAIRSVCEPIFAQPLKDISFGQLLVRLFQTAGQFKMEIQPQLMLLQKTLLNIEGLGRELYPQLDLWQTAKPYLENWFKEMVGPKALLRTLKDRAPFWIEQYSTFPDLLLKTLQQKPQSIEIKTTVATKPTGSKLLAGLGLGLLLSAGVIYGWMFQTNNTQPLLPALLAGAGVASILINWLRAL